MKERINFKAASLIEKINFYIVNVIILIAFIFCALSINSNPVLISIILSVLAIIFFFSAYQQIIIYDDKVEIIAKGIFKINTSKKTIYINQILAIDTNLKYEKNSFLFAEILFKYLPVISASSWNDYTFNLIDGSSKSFSSKIYKKDLIRAFKLIRELSKNRIDILGIN